jgi:hypothetical protein
MKYLNLKSAEELGLTIGCYTYPDEWMECDGSKEMAPGIMIGQQKRNTFGLSYRTKVGNDTDGEDHGYKLHLVYGCSASPSDRSYTSTNDSPDAVEFSYEVTTTPIQVDGYKPISSVTIDSTKADPTQLAALEAILYGSDTEESSEARLPLPTELATIFKIAG